ncbi:hypothetical protein BJ138DRAFT_408077 [Hygrophoropsis aurantiaca]|uniref:Uncharacterized protein n=1 Tax=Hygrophoropsis aurantiaca TaxID=72124 RepID=A0ACB8A3W6_9AGAM|nr:hypothetical protein BJ138DRAFT_408077 [Hygrophoropsis aurantiaca]
MCDIIITIQTTRLLFQQKSQTSYHTKSLIVRLVKLTIETGMITALATSLELLMSVFLTPTSHLIIFYSLSKLYANCLLATLNARLTLPDDTLQSTDGTEQNLRRRTSVRTPRMSNDLEFGFSIDLLPIKSISDTTSHNSPGSENRNEGSSLDVSVDNSFEA